MAGELDEPDLCECNSPPAPKRLRRESDDAACGDMVLLDGSLTSAVAAATPELREALKLRKKHNYGEALSKYRDAAVCFTRSHADTQKRLMEERVRLEGAVTVMPEAPVLQDELRKAALAFSGVAHALENLAKMAGRPLAVAELKEALLMRLRAKTLYDDAVEFGGMIAFETGSPPHNRQNVHELAAQLCQRDEVKEFLHGLLVDQMDRFHTSHPTLKHEFDLRPCDRALPLTGVD